jgi:hypothetical protein
MPTDGISKILKFDRIIGTGSGSIGSGCGKGA